MIMSTVSFVRFSIGFGYTPIITISKTIAARTIFSFSLMSFAFSVSAFVFPKNTRWIIFKV